ncbi:MAG: thymidine phosphorylase [Aquabacterium sp.]|nr:thymidine phosphorylase [Aquabacterium sp.]
MLAVEIIRAKRDGQVLSPAQIAEFVRGLVDGSWSEGQVAALAMAVLWRGMQPAETAALTRAMWHSGQVLQWRDAKLAGPVLDKHSTGGVGDKVSLMLAPLVAACGGVVPMISGRGLGHTGGTLDKLEALPGFDTAADPARLRQLLHQAGCAIVGAGPTLAPADRRLYAVRDVTATVESIALITASILSKKLAAGLQALVLDVKVGNGAVSPDVATARALAHSLVEVAAQCGLPTCALLTDMDQPLGRCAGNALEVDEALAWLRGEPPDERLTEVTLALAAQLLVQGGLAADLPAARSLAQSRWRSGAAAEHFARMVAAQGGPTDVLRDARLPLAPVQQVVPAPHTGFLAHIDTRALGTAVVALGGGRARADDRIDPRVGLSGLHPLGTALQAGTPLAVVHAATAAAAHEAAQRVTEACRIDHAPPPRPSPVLEVVRA